jgi:hypothetical protein
MEIKFKAVKGSVTGRVLFYKSEEKFENKEITIKTRTGKISGTVYQVQHPSLRRDGLVDYPQALTLKEAKEKANKLFHN